MQPSTTPSPTPEPPRESMPNPLLTSETPLFVVFNAASGSRDAERSQAQMREILASAGRAYTFFPIEDPKQLHAIATRAAAAAEREQGAVVVAGGDGTINCVAEATLQTGRPFGIVPQGTFNYSSRAHGIPLDTEKATRALLDARLEPMQVGLVNDRIFLVNASVGLYPEILQERETYKRQYGRKRHIALWAGVRTLMRSHDQLTLEIEHDQQREVIRTPTLFVGNNPLQLERVGLSEADAIDRHRLAAVIVKPTGTAALLWLALRGALGRLGEAEHVRDFAFKRMTVRAARRGALRQVKVATDGEIHMMKAPITFAVAPRPLMLMVPQVPEAIVSPA